MQTERDGWIPPPIPADPPGDSLSWFLVFISQPSISSFLSHRLTHTHICPVSPPPPPPPSHCLWRTRSIAVHVGKPLCRYYHCFFLHPPGSESCQLWPLLKGWEREREGEKETGGWKEGVKEGGVDVEMEVPTEGRGSDGMLVSLCPSKRSNSSGEGRWWRGK